VLIKQANEFLVKGKGTNLWVNSDTLIGNIDVRLCMVEEKSRTVLIHMFKHIYAARCEWWQIWSLNAVYHFRMWWCINV